jgi:hypothetical protein
VTGTRGIKRLLLGIELTMVGIALVLAGSSGSGQLPGLVVAALGLVFALSGMAEDRPT